MWYALLIPVALGVTATLMYTLFSGIPEYDTLTESTKQEFTGRVNGILFTIYWILMRVFSPANVPARLAEFAAYTMYDIVHMLSYTSRADFYLHHITFLVSAAAVTFLVGPEQMSLVYDAAFILESTNPLLSTSWIFNVLKYPMDTIHKSLQAVTFCVWTLIRMVLFTYWGYTTLTPSHLPFFAPWLVLNTYWFYLLAKKAAKSFTSSSPSHTDADAGQRQEAGPPPSDSSQREQTT